MIYISNWENDIFETARQNEHEIFHTTNNTSNYKDKRISHVIYIWSYDRKKTKKQKNRPWWGGAIPRMYHN